MLCKKLEKIRFETGHAHDFIIRLEQTHFVYASRQSFGFSHHVKGFSKMPQSGVGSMQGKNIGNLPSVVCASSINKSLDPTPI